MQKNTVAVQSTFRNLGNGISQTRNVLNDLGCRLREQNLTPRNPSKTEIFETSGWQPIEPGTTPGPEPGVPERVPGSVPGTPSLSRIAPGRREHTENLYCAKTT